MGTPPREPHQLFRNLYVEEGGQRRFLYVEEVGPWQPRGQPEQPQGRRWPCQRSRGRPLPLPHHCRPRRRSRRRPPQRRGGSWSRRFPSPAAAAAHAAAFVAAVILVLPNSIPTATALISDRLWNHLLDICQRVRLTQLTAAPAVHESGATASCSQPLIGPVLRWPGGRLLCLWPLPPQGHRSRKGATESARTDAVAYRRLQLWCTDDSGARACVSAFCCCSQEAQGR